MEKQIGATIRKIRRQQRLTLESLAARTGLTKGYLSKIERGIKSPPVSTLSRIASALSVEIADFFERGRDRPRMALVRAGERKRVSRDGASFGYSYEALADRYHAKAVEPFVIRFLPGIEVDTLFTHQGEEMIYVLRGELAFTFDEEIFTLQPGDCVYFDASVPHRGACAGDSETEALMIIVPGPPVPQGR